MGKFQCHIVAFEGRASFPLWARQGQPTAPRRRRNAQGQLILERGICSYSQVLNFWYDAVREAIHTAGAIAWDQLPQAGGVPTGEPPTGEANSTKSSCPWVVSWSYYAQNHWRRAVRDILRVVRTFAGSAFPTLSRYADPSPAGESESFSAFEGQPSRRSGGFDPPQGGSGLSASLSGHWQPIPKTGGVSVGRFCLVLLGFSNGGDAVYQTAKALQRRGIPVDLAITVDPVRKPLRGMGFMGFRRPQNVGRWINYYQRFDRRTLAGILPIVGRHVDGADENIRLGPEDFPEPKTRPKAHVWIPSLAQVRSRIRDEIVALLQKQELR